MSDPVVIAGGGIAGAGLALALHRAGIACVVCEAHPRGDSHAGAFLALASGGMRALRVLGAEEAVAAAGDPVDTLRTLGPDGAVVAERPLAAPGDPGYRLLARGALAGTLVRLAAGRGIEVRFGARVTGAAPDPGGVTVTLADGACVRGSLLVGADGLNSAVRTLIDPASPPPRPVGQRVYYGVTSASVFGGPGMFVLQPEGLGAHVGAFGRDGDTWWFVRRDVDGPDAPPDADPLAVLRALLPGHGPVGRAVAGARDVVAFDAHDLPFVGPWYRDRMLILGDAAHAASPATGRGASMALEDVVVLAKALREHGAGEHGVGDPGPAAEHFERLRRGRTQANVVASAALSRPDAAPDGADPGEPLPEDVVRGHLDWDRPLP